MIAKLLMAITMALTAFNAPGTTADVFAAGDHYMMVDDAGYLTVWAESNGQAGLQPTPVVVLGLVVAQADTQLHL